MIFTALYRSSSIMPHIHFLMRYCAASHWRLVSYSGKVWRVQYRENVFDF